ncbi:MAG TPA: hypothetical protein VMB03_13280 [Bryobacteraceae bacterium]|nr:hypothetical protein [Bryobacteraceae bacterium]
MMKADVRRAALAALSASSHFHKGIRPAGAADQEAPCRLLAADGPDGFDEAAAAAENHWPGQTEWDLIASDYRLATEQDSGWPEGLGALGMPFTIARFTSFEGDGSAEDPGGESEF